MLFQLIYAYQFYGWKSQFYFRICFVVCENGLDSNDEEQPRLLQNLLYKFYPGFSKKGGDSIMSKRMVLLSTTNGTERTFLVP